MAGVRNLLMGGQACVLYGAAEFSRDTDLAVLASPENLRCLERAMDALDAAVIAVPPAEARFLDRGHAVHFRCGRDDVRGLRIDVMSRMRGVDEFSRLWERRTTVQLSDSQGSELEADVLALPDLVAAKKTQRDKDWPMISRLVAVNYFQFRSEATSTRVPFWLRELRTPELLIECVQVFPDVSQEVAAERPAVAAALVRDAPRVESEFAAEQAREQELDRVYWAPLRAELEQLRRARHQGGHTAAE
ncbi:MAG TPA: hypothetical protein VFW98_00315 [Gemmatimonadaceae bacterium]|nr:hypothetical protein [Gemmatimonadaceae bacterium]